jgi:hypothetical protein
MEDIYLCVQGSRKKNYLCNKFSSFEEADEYFHDNYRGNVNHSTMIPICKLNPFKHLTLKYKLAKIFGNIEIND